MANKIMAIPPRIWRHQFDTGEFILVGIIDDDTGVFRRVLSPFRPEPSALKEEALRQTFKFAEMIPCYE
jgi:hypothetical protein